MDYIGINGESSQTMISLLIDGCEGFPFGFQPIVAFKFIEAFSSALALWNFACGEPAEGRIPQGESAFVCG
jgi:hypothetical protein